MEVFFLIGSVQGLFFVFLLLAKENKGPHDIMLLAWFMGIAFNLLSVYTAFVALYDHWPSLLYLSPFSESIIFVHGPCLYLYTRYLISRNRGFHYSDIFHFVPFLLSTLWVLSIFFANGSHSDVFFNLDQMGPTYYSVSRFFFIWHGPIYILWTFWLLLRHRANIRNKFSYTEKVDLVWLRNLALGVGTIWILVFLQRLTNLPLNGDVLIYLCVTLFIFILGFLGLRQNNIFSWNKSITKPAEGAVGSYTKSKLSVHRANIIAEEMEELLNTKKIFLKSRLTLEDIANELGTSSHVLSQVLNTYIGKNFFDLINERRIEDAKKRLLDPKYDNLTILGIALESGFNSKSSFNRIFKKYMGVTPTEFKNGHESKA